MFKIDLKHKINVKSKQHKFKMHMGKLLVWECVFVWSDRLFPQRSAKRRIHSLVVFMLQPAILLRQFRNNIITSFKHGLPRPFFRGCRVSIETTITCRYLVSISTSSNRPKKPINTSSAASFVSDPPVLYPYVPGYLWQEIVSHHWICSRLICNAFSIMCHP